MTMTRPAPINQADFAATSPTGPAPKTTTTSPSTMSPSWAPKKPVGTAAVGTAGVGERAGVSLVEPVGDDRRPDVGERHPYVLRLSAVVAAGGVRVAVDP